MPLGLGCLCGRLLLGVADVLRLLEPLVELVDTTGCIYYFLPTRKKRMALGADFQLDVADGGSGRERATADAGNRCDFILRMDSLFHDIPQQV